MILRKPAAKRVSFFRIFLTSCLVCCTTLMPYAQGLVGGVVEEFSRHPVPGATGSIIYNDSIEYRFVTDSLGRYTWRTGKAGRVSVHITAEGFSACSLADILLDGYSTIRLDHLLEKTSFNLPDVTVVAQKRDGFSTARIITSDDILQVAGNFQDPVRIAHSQPGIVLLNDQANQLSARGQAPIFNTWYLEGLEIVNPNHTSNAGNLSDLPTQYGGGVNMFSAQALGSTDVYIGVNPLSLNTNSGVAIDMHLHESAKPEWRAKAGLLGLELGGGTALGSRSILDFNFRYSFTGILTGLGANFGGEKINFYDGVLSFRNEGAKHQLKVFAWAGSSINEFDQVDAPEDRVRYKDFFDIDYGNQIYGAGSRFNITLSPTLYLRSGLAYSTNRSTYLKQGQFGAKPDTLDLEGQIAIVSSFAELTIRHSSRLHTNTGVEYSGRTYKEEVNPFIPFEEESFLRPYINTAYRFAPDWKLEVGGEVQRSFLYDTWTPGYRAQLGWSPNEHHSFLAGLRHSAGEPLFKRIQNNTNVHFVSTTYELGWDYSRKEHQLGINLYYQRINDLTFFILTDVPLYLADYPYSPFSTDILGFQRSGISGHAGIEANWNYKHANGWRFGFNQSVYDSRRGYLKSQLDPGRYNGQFATHFSISKEIIKERDGKNKIWNFALRGLLNGGIWEAKIDEFKSEEFETTFYEYPGFYTQQLPMYKRLDAGISRTIAFEKIRWRYSLDIQNLAGFKNTAYHYYDPFLNQVVAQEQLGIIPVLSVQASW